MSIKPVHAMLARVSGRRIVSCHALDQAGSVYYQMQRRQQHQEPPNSQDGRTNRPTARRVMPADDDFADVIHEPVSEPLYTSPAPDSFLGAAEPEEFLVAGASERTTEEGGESELRGAGLLPNTERIEARQEVMRKIPLDRLLERVMNYLRSSCNEKLVDEEEEDILFPVIIERFREFSVSQLLEIVSALHARSTLVRYGTKICDLARDRISVIANAAAKQRREATSSTGAEESLFAEEEEEKKRVALEDPVLADAVQQMTPETVLNCLLVMSANARRKRDLAFFHAMGVYFAFFINHYKDPHDLVRVLTAFSRAKILPPRSFLAMLSRRFPVLCKKTALETLPCYRAMVNFAKMGHEQMNIYRFFSDTMLCTIESNVTEKKRQLKLSIKRQENSEATESSKADEEATHTSVHDILSPTVHSTTIKTRFHEVVGVKPSMFTKWLFILAKYGAPYQQYLRPFIQPIIIPMLPHFPPPSFTRLLSAISYFKCDDNELLEPVIDFMCHRKEVLEESGRVESEGEENGIKHSRLYCPTRADLFVLLTMLSREGTALPANISKFLHFCAEVFLESSLVLSLSSAQSSKKTKRIFKDEKEQFVLRPGDMCSIARILAQLQRRVEIPLEDLGPMRELMGHFSRRLLALLQLGVVSVLQVDDFADLCRQQLYPDEDGSLEKLMSKRREMEPFVDEDGMVEEDIGDATTDIDIRETFFKIVVVNDAYRYIAYRPLPGSLQVDFREALTKVSFLDLAEAVDLYERCFPSALKPPVRLLLSRSFLAKFNEDGEEVISEDGSELVLRRPPEQLVSRKDLEHFVKLISRTPMNGVRESSIIMKFIKTKAERLGLQNLVEKTKELAHC